MNVTFPHMGSLYIAASKLLAYIDVPFVVPPANGKGALSIGAEISPEEMCLPFKYMAGNLDAAYDMGADTVIMVATGGPCRLGEYAELLKDVLENAGCKYEWVIADGPSGIGFRGIVKRLSALKPSPETEKMRTVIGLIMTLRLIVKNDRFRRKLQKNAGYLNEPYQAVKLMRETDAALEKAKSFAECFDVLKQSKKRLMQLEKKAGANPVKILVAGEIYTSIEPEANGRLEEKLIAAGCSVKRHIDISWWIKYTFITAIIPDKIRSLFMNRGLSMSNVGGYGRETAGRIMNDRWCDGVIKIMPAGCMPEIVTKAFCRSVEEKKDVKILHLIYDGLSSQAGYETRIEAFVDMLERKKNVLDGDRHRFDKYGYGADG